MILGLEQTGALSDMVHIRMEKRASKPSAQAPLLGFHAVFALIAIFFAMPAFSEPIRGAGSTFAAPIIAKWSKAYQQARADGGDFISPDWVVDYELVGSLAGIMRLRQPELDFAATDAPIPASDVQKNSYLQFPIVVGGVAIVANVPGIKDGELKLTGQLLADIYLGKVQNWSDPAVRAANPDLKLPDLRISVIHRKDGSGTTFTLTEFLSAVSAEWKQKYGADTLISWPLGTSAQGTQAVMQVARATAGAIAYLEFGQASRAGLPLAAIGNRAGEFVRPQASTFTAAVAAGEWDAKQHFFRSLVDQSGSGVYPIVAATFVVVPLDRGPTRVKRVQDLFEQAFETGGADAAALGFVPVPADLAKAIKSYWAKPPRAGG
ncbi:MAG: phosphate ABC transporter substrate-binding protein PstS [Rhabdaerophilum sp.]